LGYIVLKLLRVYKNEEQPTDRDSFKFKRVELSGSLLYDLFNEYYNLQQTYQLNHLAKNKSKLHLMFSYYFHLGQ